MMGYSQEVRQRTLTPSFRWFESIYPNQLQQTIMGCRQVVRQRTLTPSFQRFESFHPSQFLPVRGNMFYLMGEGIFIPVHPKV